MSRVFEALAKASEVKRHQSEWPVEDREIIVLQRPALKEKGRLPNNTLEETVLSTAVRAVKRMNCTPGS